MPRAPFLKVTFNQPMVPLTTLAALSAEEVPVKLTPALPGTWKWVGTQTLTFEYASELIDRFPMATDYVAEWTSIRFHIGLENTDDLIDDLSAGLTRIA